MPITARDWAIPFMEQAREDLHAAWVVQASGQSASTLCMLLQMVFEKIGKAYYARAGTLSTSSHAIASHLINVMRRHPTGVALFRSHTNAIAFVSQLESAHPQVAGNHRTPPWPQLEYPWRDVTDTTVLYPKTDLPLVQRVYDPRDRIAVDCLRFACALEKQMTTIVP
ncbi:MAG: hypothetical protein NTX50_22160 [Candidatus Sumerlaeota bacterium]|nr:hypothetical protein [Candidatus Sumerlaeota bacterium]